MSPDDSPPDRSDGAARSLAIGLEGLIWALNSRDPFGESRHRLHLESGELVFLAGPDAADEAAEGPRDSDRWLCIEPIESSQAFETMEDFAEQCEHASLARALRQALRQRKPFRRFKDMLAAHPAQREAGFAFERHAMEMIARRWCEDHGISPARTTAAA
ncbi:MAG TPA: UPF0158 family protein [Rubrivivax sp.]|nr:UPF0158 family protein [Rubrivivax sp.]